MFRKPIDVALRHFEIMYNTFSLRSWVKATNEPFCRDQYVQFLDHLRTGYGPNFDITSTSKGLIEFLMGLEFLQDREHLLYLFKLCCLCTATPSSPYPDVTLGNLTTVGHQSRLKDVVLPCQSYLTEVRGSVSHCVDETNLSQFMLLSASFGQSGLSATYDHWASLDKFGRSGFHKSLLSS